MLDHLRTLREDRDLSQADLARVLHIHQTTYSDYELGNLNIPIPVLKELALYFDTSVDYLLGLTNHPTPTPGPDSGRTVQYKNLGADAHSAHQLPFFAADKRPRFILRPA